jgi:hypothetical protein
MKLSDFILLNENEKKLAVLHQGVLIAKRNSYNYMVFLFQLNGYYVETFCNAQNKAIEEFRIFGNTQLLRPYLEAMPIEDLLN